MPFEAVIKEILNGSDGPVERTLELGTQTEPPFTLRYGAQVLGKVLSWKYTGPGQVARLCIRPYEGEVEELSLDSQTLPVLSVGDTLEITVEP